MKARAFVIRGQYGWITSAGMDQLCLKLQSIPGMYASIYNWDEDAWIVQAIDQTKADVSLMLIGFSLGAHTCTRVPRLRKHRIFELIVGFDPSKLARLQSVPLNVLRAICFYNPNAWLFGGREYVGVNVENYPINNIHLAMDWDTKLWQRTIDAVNKVMKTHEPRTS